MAGLTYTHVDAVDLTTAEMYGRAMVELANEDPTIVGLSADLATSTKMAVFAKAHPKRFYNAGIAEQNMFSMAAGMALSGLTPFVSTFATFASLRAVEQIRTDICYQKLNVKIIATHAGLSFGAAGTTHHATEDLSVMRSLANLVVECPADGLSAAYCLQACHRHLGPTYIRINRGFDQVVYDQEVPDYQIGQAITLREGSDLTLIACGSGVWRAVQAANILAADDGLSVRVIDMHSIKPIDAQAIADAVIQTRRVITVEDHNVMGGLGSAVAEVAAELGKGFVFRRLGVPDVYSIIGQPEDLFAHYGYDENGVLAAAREVMRLDFEEDEDWEDEF